MLSDTYEIGFFELLMDLNERETKAGAQLILQNRCTALRFDREGILRAYFSDHSGAGQIVEFLLIALEDDYEYFELDDFEYEEEDLAIAPACSCKKRGLCEHIAAVPLLFASASCAWGVEWPNCSSLEMFTPDALLEYDFENLLPDVKHVLVNILLDDVPIEKAKADKNVPWWRRYLEAKSKQQRADLARSELQRRIPGLSKWAAEAAVKRYLPAPNPIEALGHFEEALKNAKHFSYNAHKTKADTSGLHQFLESDEAKDLKLTFQNNLFRNRITDWLSTTPEQNTRDKAEVVWSLRKDARGIPRLSFDVLLSSTKLKRSPRSAGAIDALARESKIGKRQLKAVEEQLVQWIADLSEVQIRKGAKGAPNGAMNQYKVGDAMAWINRWFSLELISWEDGSPCRFDLGCATMVVAPNPEGALAWHVRTPDTPDPILFSEVKLCADAPHNPFSEPTHLFIRHQDTLRLLVTKGIPMLLLEDFYQNSLIPTEMLRGNAMGATLIERYLDPEVDSTAFVNRIPTQATVIMRHNPDYNELIVYACAEANDGSLFSYGAGEWRQVSLKQPEIWGDEDEQVGLGEEELPAVPSFEASQDALVTMVRNEDVAPLSVWIERLIPSSARLVSSEAGRFTHQWKVKRKDHADFLAIWQARPGGVRYQGDKGFQRYVTPLSVPSFKVKIESSGVDFLQVSVAMENEMELLDFKEIQTALKNSQDELLLLPGGRLYHRDDLEGYQKSLDALLEMGVEPDGEEHQVHAIQAMDSNLQAAIDDAQSNKHFQQLRARVENLIASFKGIPTIQPTGDLETILRPYQQEGVNFLVWACRTFGGALLADDMGLGKTLQSLAALDLLRVGLKTKRPSLVVCPTSVAHNWVREAHRFLPHLKVLLLQSGKERAELLKTIPDYDLVIKNYALTRRDIETLRDYKWAMVCVDEAQNIKNPAAAITKALKSLNAEYRIALTGTPIENRLMDLWSVMDFTVPGCLGSMKRFQEKLQTHHADQFYRSLRARLRPLLLRRLKEEVAPELPPRIEERLDCEMAPKQRKLYLSELKKTKTLLEAMRNPKLKGKERIQILASLTRLRQICCHPKLIQNTTAKSGKLEELETLIGRLIEDGHKILVFSQFVSMLEHIETRLKTMKTPFYKLTGKTRKRKEIIEAFEESPDPCVFMISLKAGGSGLNLTAASHVILFDPWWNPAVEAQAIDRTHRIGQDKTVVAFRLVTLGTIEERIMELQERKRAMVENVLQEDSFNSSLSKEDFEFILKPIDEEETE